MVGERTDLRFVLAENVVLESVTPVLLGIPIAGLLIWLIVNRGLKPLSHLSKDLREKRVHDLSPLQYRNTPHELDQVVQSINGLIHRLSQALEREKRFSSDAAHELRTPISALKVQLHNLEQEVGARGEAFGELQSGVERMQHLVEQLLSLYRSSPEQFAANCKPLDFRALVQNVIARQHALIEARQQSIELEADACVINGEAFALDTMIANLLGNAIKYTHEGGRILVRLISSETGFYLTVDDNGPGIPEAERERIFERFYRRSSAFPEAPGCGLGLAIVTHVARLHRGEVSVGDSLFERGASFRIDFYGVE
jgi:two-component system sensor histidine kinase QseC